MILSANESVGKAPLQRGKIADSPFQIFGATDLLQLFPPQSLHVCVDSFLRRGDFAVDASHLEEGRRGTASQVCGEAFVECRKVVEFAPGLSKEDVNSESWCLELGKHDRLD
jgi:hypothetical protein